MNQTNKEIHTRLVNKNNSIIKTTQIKSELYKWIVFYVFIADLFALIWLMPTEWLHWVARAVLTVVLAACGWLTWAIDHATEIDPKIPMSREEEIIDRELKKAS